MSVVVLKKEDIHRGNLILVNRNYGYRETKKESLISVREGETVLLRQRAVILLQNLMEELHGWRSIVPVSGFRSLEEQTKLWEDSLAESGREFTEKFVAFPGHSEHQTGLAIDLGLKKEQIDFICPEFPYSGICQAFREKAADYGFIERYPAGKEQITGIGHEPWHFRYVGAPHAAIMGRLGLVLEEYMEFLKQYVFGEASYRYEKNGQLVEVSYIPAKQEDITLDLEETGPYSISGNNMDGYIITLWNAMGKSGFGRSA